jgi:gamma-glutamyltranspeptidase
MTPETLNAGMKAGITPGNIGGYLVQLQRFGTMKVADVFARAIGNEGFILRSPDLEPILEAAAFIHQKA